MTDESKPGRYEVTPGKPPYYPIERVVVRGERMAEKLVRRALAEGLVDELQVGESAQVIDLDQRRRVTER